MNRSDEEEFLSRWSARKLKARVETESEDVSAAPAAAPPKETAAEKSDAEILDELGLPDPDSLVKGDDFKAFLGAGVPVRLRARALRRLWLSDPVLANLDGLNDYEQDFTDKATVRPDLKTVYRVGKGLLREPPQAAAMEGAEPAPPRPAASPGEDDPETLAERPMAAGLDADPPDRGDTAAGPPDPPSADETADGTARAAPGAGGRLRRMHFRFEG